jgi:hypothetical protein
MGLNPALILGGIIAMGGIAVFGVIETPNKTTEIFGFCGMITGTLLLMLKQDRDNHRTQQRFDKSDERIQQRFDKSDEQTVVTGDEVKAAVQEKGTEVKAALRATTDKVVDTVVEQTNGHLDRKFKEAAEATAARVIEAIPQVLPQVLSPVIEQAVAKQVSDSTILKTPGGKGPT